jgi:hypothetical protein
MSAADKQTGEPAERANEADENWARTWHHSSSASACGWVDQRRERVLVVLCSFLAVRRARLQTGLLVVGRKGWLRWRWWKRAKQDGGSAITPQVCVSET